MELSLDFWSFIIGLVSSFVFPFAKWIINKYNSHFQYKKFKTLIFNDYIEPIKEMSFGDRKKFDQDTLINEVNDSLKKLDYLLKNEISFYHGTNQFKYIRVLEYTKRLFYNFDEIINWYNFVDTTPVGEEKVFIHNENKVSNINKAISNYIKDIDDYVNLKTDSFERINIPFSLKND